MQQVGRGREKLSEKLFLFVIKYTPMEILGEEGVGRLNGRFLRQRFERGGWVIFGEVVFFT